MVRTIQRKNTGAGARTTMLASALLAMAVLAPVNLVQADALGQATQRSADGPDNDADGIRNQDDLDDDNDGILDIYEGGLDEDGDGVPDAGALDTDGDGTPDVLDLDSDNDGILDNLEARQDREAVNALDLNPNGAIDIAFPVGENGIADAIETEPDSGVLIYALLDSDDDGRPDYRDSDSDNDGIFDITEAGGMDNDATGTLDNFADGDGKGVDDAVQSAALPVFDTDGDGILDFRDKDSDNDQIPDAVENFGGEPNNPVDTDGDGAADHRETDSDGDGLSDTVEAGKIPSEPDDVDGNGIWDFREAVSASNQQPDRDADGIGNIDDLDDDNDGIPDVLEGLVDENGDGVADDASRDTDGDGTPDVNDLDSDNDGLLDNREAHPDFNVVNGLDQVVNGAIDLFKEVGERGEVGENGIADVIETSADSGVLNFEIQDTDGDGTPDFIDLDSDGDGIFDLIEAGGVDADGNGQIDNFGDADDKGVDDTVQASALPVFDTDSDDTADYRDTDSDNDGLPDSLEAGSDPSNPIDSDNDGAADFRELDSDGDDIPDNEDFDNSGVIEPPLPPISADVDGDGVMNEDDLDDDNDGITDDIEGNEDSDGDRTLNQYDLDSDNDGITDITEATALIEFIAQLDVDSDGRLDAPVGENGIADALESTPDSGTTIFIVADSDGDGVPDFKDLDSDNDSIYDTTEAGRPNTGGNGRLDGAEFTNTAGLAGAANGNLLDTDNDGIVDNRDLDSDNDGITDLLEAGGIDVDGNGRVDDFTDLNGDGAEDGLQRIVIEIVDTDFDTIPDYLDLDSDQDSLSDVLESLGMEFDQDNNGTLDVFTDSDGDGLDDFLAAGPVGVNDTDRDGIPDQVDYDSDGDGMSDLIEAGGTDVDGNRMVDVLLDTDGDGVPDVVDFDSVGNEDADGDGIADFADVDFTGGTDTDNDGIDDMLDPDSDGNGFVGPASGENGVLDDGQGTPVQLPDSDSDGTPDVQDSFLPVTTIETDDSGGGFGCNIVSADNGSKDPWMILMFGAALMSLLIRTRRRAALRLSSDAKGLRNAGLVLLAGASLTLSACSAIGLGGGQDRGGSDHKARVYIGGGVLVSNLEPDADSQPGVTVDETQSAGGTLQLGYDISNRFSIEAHGSDLGEATFDPPAGATVGYQVGGLSALVYGFNDSGDRSRREGFSVFGRLGGGTMRNQGEGVRFERVNDFHLLAGLGLEYGFESGLGLRAEVVSHDSDAQYAQLGLVYRIGDAGRRGRLRVPTPPPVPAAPQVNTTPLPAAPEPAAAPLDSDADGVIDIQDNCPSTPIGRPVNSVGCELFNGVIEGINFESGSDRLTSDSVDILSGVATTLRQYPDIRVSVEAHTDNQGSAESNLQLSKRRAIAVARFLVEQGVEGNRLRPQAYGESQPRETNDTAAGRLRNRRVEFQVVN